MNTITYLPQSVGFFLQNANLDGSIPSEFGSCTKLELLSLPRNALTGSLPTELGNLLMLKKVNVDWNQDISQTVPEEYANLAFMEDLYISRLLLIILYFQI